MREQVRNKTNGDNNSDGAGVIDISVVLVCEAYVRGSDGE